MALTKAELEDALEFLEEHERAIEAEKLKSFLRCTHTTLLRRLALLHCLMARVREEIGKEADGAA